MITESDFSIAIADDHQLMRQSLIQIFISFGYNVKIEAENGKVLIEKLEAGELPDICVIDINMPILDGFKTTTYIKQKWPFIKVLIFSLDDNTRNQQKAFACGADAFISKYGSLELLQQTLEKLKK
ncbi:MAG TPA: response regulator transcription factor [Chitinophagaceae bacterium]|nr:response regulator transcription factor [Chitinophagaceae bacterium]